MVKLYSSFRQQCICIKWNIIDIFQVQSTLKTLMFKLLFLSSLTVSVFAFEIFANLLKVNKIIFTLNYTSILCLYIENVTTLIYFNFFQKKNRITLSNNVKLMHLRLYQKNLKKQIITQTDIQLTVVYFVYLLLICCHIYYCFYYYDSYFLAILFVTPKLIFMYSLILHSTQFIAFVVTIREFVQTLRQKLFFCRTGTLSPELTSLLTQHLNGISIECVNITAIIKLINKIFGVPILLTILSLFIYIITMYCYAVRNIIYLHKYNFPVIQSSLFLWVSSHFYAS